MICLVSYSIFCVYHFAKTLRPGGTAIGRSATVAGGKPNAGGRFARDFGNDKWGGGGRFTGRQNSQNQSYQRSNSHANNHNDDDGDRFGGGFYQHHHHHHHNQHHSNNDDEDYRRNSLPEWSLDDPATIDVTKVGTFDASGAFHEASFDEESQKSGDSNADDRKKSTGSRGGILERATKTDGSTKDSKDQQNNRRSAERNEDGSTRTQSMSSNGGDSTSSQKKESRDESSGYKQQQQQSTISENNSNRQQQTTTASSMMMDFGNDNSNKAASKIDYFNMSDPSLSPSASPSKQKQDNFQHHLHNNQQHSGRIHGKNLSNLQNVFY